MPLSSRLKIKNHPNLERGVSRYRLSVTLAQAGQVKPYGWEIRDDETNQPVRRSAEHYRTPRAAWDAGKRILDGLGRGNAGTN